jgi:hypothetical protein
MKKYYIILGTLQAFTALGAIPAGLAYLLDTSGARLGVTPELLANSPFSSFLIPGLFLLVVNGIGNAVGAFLSFTRNKHAAYAGIILGAILFLWIIIQVIWISLSSFMQPLFFIVGIAEIYLGWRILKNKTGIKI